MSLIQRVFLFVRAFAGMGVAVVLAGCAHLGKAETFDPGELDSSEGWLTVRGVPVVRQKRDTECGPAALAMVFGYWSISMDQDEIERECPSASTAGVKARDLRDLARRMGLKAYLIHGVWKDLQNEVHQGHPVVVGLIKPYLSGAFTHYEVVVAVHPERQVVVTLDPGRGWRQNSFEGFQEEWEPAGFLTLVFSEEDQPSRGSSPHERRRVCVR